MVPHEWVKFAAEVWTDIASSGRPPEEQMRMLLESLAKANIVNPETRFVYGIRNRSDGHMERVGMTEGEAWAWMATVPGDRFDPWNLYEIQCRPQFPWRTVASKEKGRPERRPPTVDS